VAGKVKMVGLGGFLGSGKTTLAIELGKKMVTDLGKKVAIVTNDQGERLVDTNLVHDYGFAVTEVVGGCLCCKFKDFMAHAQEIVRDVKPDVILAESVGSCTDFLATVYGPIRLYYDREFELAPFLVMVDATAILEHFNKLDTLSSPSTPLGSLYTWQVKDGDILAINKVDLASKDELQRIKALLMELNKDAEIVEISAKTGQNVDKLLEMLIEGEHQPRATITKEVNYDTYATAEAELGWFNGVYRIYSGEPLEVDALIKELLTEINRRVRENKGVVAHAKTRFSTKQGWAKASLVISDDSVDIVGETPPPSKEIDVILNIRASVDPDVLTNIAKTSLEAITSRHDAQYGDWSSTSFKPGYPKPYYRLVHT
jgi:G3E family GTPase